MSEGRKILDMGVRHPAGHAALETIMKGAGTDLYSVMPDSGGVFKISNIWPFSPEQRETAKRLLERGADGLIMVDIQPDFCGDGLPVFDGCSVEYGVS